MKEIGKLIELLNEWSKTAIKNKCNWTDVYDEDGLYFMNLHDRDMTMEVEEVISKTFGFIKWLVENDKIDRKKIEKNQTYQLCLGLLIDRGYYVNVLLMLLSISDTPIDLLCSLLK